MSDSKSETQKKVPANLPDLKAAADAFNRFVTTVAWLRDKKDGCPWDLEQDHKTLRRYMVEEAYEAAEAMSEDDPQEIRDELGDVLLQVVLNAQVAHDDGAFQIADVIRSIDEKMQRRHPHVFANEDGIKTAKDVRSNWDKIKAGEKASAGKQAKGVFDGVEKTHPALLQAFAIGKKAAKINFDWDEVGAVLKQLSSEVKELEAEFAAANFDKKRAVAEIGDVFFSLVQLCRHLGVDPEVAALDGNRKFLKRFKGVESLAASEGVDVATATKEQLEAWWQQSKRDEQKRG